MNKSKDIAERLKEKIMLKWKTEKEASQIVYWDWKTDWLATKFWWINSDWELTELWKIKSEQTEKEREQDRLKAIRENISVASLYNNKTKKWVQKKAK